MIAVVLALGAALAAPGAAWAATISATPAGNVKAGQPVALTATAESAPPGAEITYAWTVPAGVTLTGGDQQTATATFPDRGADYLVTVDLTYALAGIPVGGEQGTLTIHTDPDGAPAGAKIAGAPGTATLGQPATLTGSATDPDGDTLTYSWSDSLAATFSAAGAPTTTWTPTARGLHVITLEAKDPAGLSTSTTASVFVPDRPPVASFAVTGSGATRTLRSTSSDPDGDALTYGWSVNGGVTLSAPTAQQTTATFPGPGAYLVRLTVTDPQGATASDAAVLVVSAPPKPARPSLMSPFPIVRIRGRIFPSYTKFDEFSVRAPRGAVVRVRCAGRGCPRRWSRATAGKRTRWVAFRGLERRMSAGTVLEVFVSERGRIGKYTRFVVRAHKAPSRRDRCLRGRSRVVSCPAG